MENFVFQWSDEFSVNIEEVDEQHRTLVGLVNDLHVAIREHRGKTASRKVLDRLAEYTRTHFMLEESLMRLTRYPGFDVHRQQHEDLIAQVQSLQYKLHHENAAITFELLNFLRKWLIQHILESDKRFGAFFQKTEFSRISSSLPQNVSARPEKRAWWKFW